jgi:hypothetical protein
LTLGGCTTMSIRQAHEAAAACEAKIAQGKRPKA